MFTAGSPLAVADALHTTVDAVSMSQIAPDASHGIIDNWLLLTLCEAGCGIGSRDDSHDLTASHHSPRRRLTHIHYSEDPSRMPVRGICSTNSSRAVDVPHGAPTVWHLVPDCRDPHLAGR